jgi:hypothetical protein
LGFNDLWYDEACSIIISRGSWQCWNPPLYFAILHYWAGIFGMSEFALRFPSALFSVFGIYTTFLFGQRLFNFRVGLFSAILMSFSAFNLWYAQEARPYSLSVFLSVASTYFLYRALTETKGRFWGFFILSSIFLLYCDITYSSVVLLGAQLLSAAIFFRKKFSAHIFYFFCILIFFLPRLTRLVSKLMYIKEGFWIPAPNVRSLITTIENFNAGYNMTPLVYGASIVLSGLLLSACCLTLKQNKHWPKRAALTAILLFLPMLFLFVFSKICIPVYLDRGLIIVSPYYYILLSAGAEYCFPRKWFRAAAVPAIIALFAFSTLGYFNNWMFRPEQYHVGVHIKKPFQPAVRFIESNFRAGDIIAHTNSHSKAPFGFYMEGKELHQYFLFQYGMIDTNWNRPFLSGARHIDVNDMDLRENNRLWVIGCNYPRDGRLDENSTAVIGALDKRYRRELCVYFDGLWVLRYAR